MSQTIADYVRNKCGVIAVNDAYRLAPWGDALVANDRAWWTAHPDALQFAGQKYCGTKYPGTEKIFPGLYFGGGINSGLQGMRVAEDEFRATLILLCGFDMRGSHFFGQHPAPLRNTSDVRRLTHIRQFDKWDGCEVVNCTPNSALKKFRFAELHEILHP